MAEKMNITFHYDERADILYLDFGSNEPCYTDDLDGFLMIDIGWFSNLPRGAKIISPKARNIKSVNVVFSRIAHVCQKLMEKQAKRIQTSEPVFETNLSRGLNKAFAQVS